MRLKDLRIKKGLSQIDFAKAFGVAQNTVSNWESEKRKIDNDTLSQLAAFFDVSTDYLLGIVEPSTKKGIKIPVLGVVQAGIPIEAVENIIDYEEITEEMAKSGEHFGLVVQGESMEPKFSEGDVVIVRKQSDVDSGDIAIVMVNGNEATVKKVSKHGAGISLIPLNTSFETKFYTNDEIASLPVAILGKVIELRAKF